MENQKQGEFNKRSSDNSAAFSIDCEKLISKDLLESLDDLSPNEKMVKFEDKHDIFMSPFVLQISEKEKYTRKKTWQKPHVPFVSERNQNKLSKTPKPRFSAVMFSSPEELSLNSLERDYWTVQNKRSGWVCCVCRNFNYENRKYCNVCNKPKSVTLLGKKNKEIIEFFDENNWDIPQFCLEKTKKLVIRDGDWECEKCSNINFSFREFCNRCRLKR